MGFLDLYGGTERLYLDDKKEWWVDLKKSLTNAENDQCHKALVRSQEVTGGGGAARTKFDIDTAAYARARVLTSIENWNLTGKGSDEILSVDDESISSLPQIVFNKINVKVEELNSESGDSESSTFPASSKIRNANGAKRATDTPPVLA